MADTVLMLGGEFGSRFPKFRNQKNRIIPKAIGTTRSICNHPFHHPLHTSTQTGWVSNRDDTAETGSTLLLGEPLQLSQDQAKALFIRRIHTRETGRINARGSTKRINL